MQLDALVQAGFLALVQVGLTATIVVVSWRAATGRLKRNPTVGIRMPSTMRSDEAWMAGHRAALRLTPLYLLQLAVTLTLLIVTVAQRRPLGAVMAVAIGGTLLYLPIVIFAALIAGRAAKNVDRHSSDQPSPSPIRYSKTIHIYAAINGVMLACTSVGLWFLAARATGNGIPPNRGLGFRDQQTLATEAGWYAAQRVGFHIGAVAATAITAAVFAVVAVVYARRLHPAWALVVPSVGLAAVALAFLIAGHYADKAAVSATSGAAPGGQPHAACSEYSALPKTVGLPQGVSLRVT
jgi:hypothetical protein